MMVLGMLFCNVGFWWGWLIWGVGVVVMCDGMFREHEWSCFGWWK